MSNLFKLISFNRRLWSRGLTGDSPTIKTSYGTITFDKPDETNPIFKEIQSECGPKTDPKIRESANSILKVKNKSYLFCENGWKTRDEIVQICEKSVIQNDDSIMAVNKPYGITVHRDINYPYDLRSILLSLADQLDIPDPASFHAVGRPDIKTTGVTVFAKTPEAIRTYRSLYTDGTVEKTYRAVVLGIPSQVEGEINVPVGLIKCSDDRYKISIPSAAFYDQPSFKKQIHKKRSCLTSYKVLQSNPRAHCSLLECTTKQGRKHQLRVHLSCHLKTPILGDHRYSTVAGRLPQKLPEPTVECLGMRSALNRQLPILLHCHSVRLSTGQTFSAPIPDYYLQICKLLGLRN